ncbi:hypothetical protein [Allobranchiibius sp. GilTou38]|uniref:hypothetical protein n=1 Tax=Allobranchiibius sp. GilTou38 TaxID=2815210 RepID=UPI001AA0D836|nr:hypothetical protein [Allobranchiibius sp. GilTou38]MBO1768249.1 hypothetical protein [Allobranchiibius sp. GilTou38]
MSDHLDEVGAELDRMVRSSVMAVSQLGDHIARRLTNQRQAAAAAAREQFLTARDSARSVYLPLTQDRAGSRATPAQLHRGWTTAQQWATRDPQASAAAAAIADRFSDRFGVAPDQVLPGTWQRTTEPAQAAQPLTRDAAAQLAHDHAPGYYTRHHPDRTDVPDGQLQTDWEHWREHGDLPTRSVREEWARHTGQLGDAQAARDAAAPAERDSAYDAALEQAWASSAQLSDAQVLSLAQEHAPAWYQRHHEDALATDDGAAQLRADWEHWRDHGQLPEAARHEEWASYVGRGQEFAPDGWASPQEREAALQQVWDEGRDERGLLEMTAHLDRMREANLDTDQVSAESLSGDLEQFRLDQQAARGVYAPLLEPAAFAGADQAAALRAWEQAAGWAGQDPAAEVAAAQLDQQFRTRWQTSPMEYLLDQLGDQAANLTEDQRAGAALDAAAADRAEAEQQRGVAEEILDTPHTAGEHQDADQRLERAVDLDSAAAIAEESVPYNRADESELYAPGVTDQARQARIESAAGFSRSTDDMLARHARSSSRTKDESPAKATLSRGRGTEQDLGR